MRPQINPPRKAILPSVKLLVGLSMTLALDACVLGPDFKSPSVPAAALTTAPQTYSYTEHPVASQTSGVAGPAGVAQALIMGQDVSAQWWQVFHSPELDALIRSGLSRSPNLGAAQAALRQARELAAAYGDNAFYPAVTGSLGAQREGVNQETTGIPGQQFFTLVNASVNVSYNLDLFGANQRGLEGLRSAVDFQRFQVEAAYLTLTANLVTTAIREASLRAQLQATHDIVDFQAKQLAVIEQQLTIGAIPKASVLAQRALLAQTRAGLPGLEKLLMQNRNQLAVYAGRLPGEPGLPQFDLASLQLPQTLPVSVPAALVRQRPDIRAGEALLHQASAQLGVAIANQYPQFNLTASYGSLAPRLDSIGEQRFSVWSLGAGLTQPIFNAGALSAKKRAAVAAYDQADAQYRSTVLSAFQNVADSLLALEQDATTLQQQTEATEAARQTLDLTSQQFKLGAVSSLSLLDAKRSYQTARISLVQAQAARYADTAALFQSLGGGWWNRPELADISVKSE